ncbi:Uncharacterised protein [uncultured archaeon]|nr:Uncharacterised protein [uncultured archaeon]
MVEENVLSSIRAAEKKAAELKELAEKESQKAIDAAQKKAIEIVASSQKEIEQKSELELKKFYAGLKKRKEAVLAKGKEASRNMKMGGEKKLPKSVDFLSSEFKKEVERI